MLSEYPANNKYKFWTHCWIVRKMMRHNSHSRNGWCCWLSQRCSKSINKNHFPFKRHWSSGLDKRNIAWVLKIKNINLIRNNTTCSRNKIEFSKIKWISAFESKNKKLFVFLFKQIKWNFAFVFKYCEETFLEVIVYMKIFGEKRIISLALSFGYFVRQFGWECVKKKKRHNECTLCLYTLPLYGEYINFNIPSATTWRSRWSSTK